MDNSPITIGIIAALTLLAGKYVASLFDNQKKKQLKEEESLEFSTWLFKPIKQILNERAILITYAVSILYLCIFHVPWRGGNLKHPTAIFIGYGSIWDAPRSYAIARVDYNMVLMELFAVSVIAGVLFYLFSQSKKP